VRNAVTRLAECIHSVVCTAHDAAVVTVRLVVATGTFATVACGSHPPERDRAVVISAGVACCRARAIGCRPSTFTGLPIWVDVEVVYRGLVAPQEILGATVEQKVV
jgi:hypothetical protein